MKSPSITDSPPESLLRLVAWLNNNGYVHGMKRVSPTSRLPVLGVPSTTTGWRLTWSRRTTRGWVESGSLWAADGEEPLLTMIPFISE